MSTLIKPVEKTVHSGLEERDIEIRVGRFSATRGMGLVTKAAGALKSFAGGDATVTDDKLVELCCELCGFVEIKNGAGEWQLLSNRTLVDSWVPDWETLAKICLEVHEYNTAFFKAGKLLQGFRDFASNIKQSNTKTLTELSDLLRNANKQP